MRRNYILDLYRTILIIFVLLYHLGLCDAGFLAVCGFLTLSGYLLAITTNSFDFNLKDYYVKRFKTLYVPLLIESLTTVFVFRYVVDIPWISIKQETISVLLGYNNHFQIRANNDYFMRSDASPFTHMWYISLLIQIEIVIPLLIFIIRKYKTHIKNNYLYAITIISIVIFVLIDSMCGMAISYYSTFSRLFSFLIGYSVYHIDYFGKSDKPIIITLLLSIFVFLTGKLAQNYYTLLMICASLLAGLFILFSKNYVYKEIKIVSIICKISYFLYLVQYPIIYIIDNLLNTNHFNKLFIEVLLIVVISIIYSFSFSNSKNKKRKCFLLLIILLSLLGGYGFLSCPDYYKQMDDLKAQLEINQKILEEKQAKYLQKIQDKQEAAINSVNEIDEALSNIDETVKNSNILFIGDSIMLGGSYNLDEYFNNYYCDAKGSRNGYLAYETLSEILEKGIQADYIVIHLGTNSGLELDEVESIASLIDKQKVFWLTVTNGWRDSQNPMLKDYCDTHDNNYLVDWYNYSFGHKEYFIEDGLHLSKDGRHVYDQFIFDNLKDVIKQDLLLRRQEIINDYNDDNNDSISFYGNDIMNCLFEEYSDNYLCYTDTNYTFDSLYAKLDDNKKKLTLSKKIFILLDNSLSINDEQISKINELLEGYEVFIFAYNKNVNNLETILSIDCYLQDGIHLNEKGKKVLIDEITKKMQ